MSLMSIPKNLLREEMDIDIEELYQRIKEAIILPDDEDEIIGFYMSIAISEKRVPNVEQIAQEIDDCNQGKIIEFCSLFGLDQVAEDCIMGKYCHNIASDLDVAIDDVLNKYNYSHIFYDVYIVADVPPEQNILIRGWPG